jgi:RNA polymerase sigma-70 factor (ECF subfamily)
MVDGRRKDESDDKLARPLLGAGGDLASTLYQELRKLASRKMRFERVNHTLQPTALVHEAYIKLGGTPGSAWQDRAHFLAVAARVMRHILVDHARSHGAGKRGAGAVQVILDENLLTNKAPTADVLAVDEALARLAVLDTRQAEILELHFFSGMTFEEIAAVLSISPRTVKRDWSMARAWLRGELSKRA